MLTLLGDNIKGIKGYADDTRSNSLKCKTPTTSIINCYTYIKMPGAAGTEADTANIAAIEPIGGNGETHDENWRNYHVRIEIQNCYYYGNNIPVTKNYTSYTKWTNIDNHGCKYYMGSTGR